MSWYKVKISNNKKLSWAFKPSLILAIVIEILLISYFALPILLHTPTVFIKIKSDSMQPALKAGDLVIISGLNKDINSLIDETIAFYDPTKGKIIVHRVIDRAGECLITRGDNTNSIDFFSPHKEYILGKVVGKINIFSLL